MFEFLNANLPVLVGAVIFLTGIVTTVRILDRLEFTGPKSSPLSYLAITVGVGLMAYGFIVGPRAAQPISPQFVPQPTKTETVPDLSFRVPDKPSVPECNVYQGDGRIPTAGYSLLFFDRPVDANGQPTGEFYMTRKPGQNNSDGPGWRSPLLDTGAPRVEVAAVLMTNELFEALLSIRPNHTDEVDAWKFGTLPPGQRLKSLIVEPRLRSSTDPRGCPP